MAKAFTEAEKNHWKELIQLHKRSGISISKWCQENNISYHSFNYWKKKFEGPKKEQISRTSFQEIPPRKKRLTKIKCQTTTFEIELEEGQSLDIFTNHLKNLMGEKC